MNQPRFFCKADRPKPNEIPWGMSLTVNFTPGKVCEVCHKPAEVELADKPLSYPSLMTA